MGWGCRRRKDPDTTQGWCPENPGWGSGLPTTAPPVPGVGLLLQRAAWGGGKAAVQSLCCHSSCGGHQRVGSAGMSPRTASPSVSGHGPQPRLQILPRAHSSVFGDRQQQPPLRTRTSPGQGEAACGQGAQVRAGAPSAGRQGTASRLSPRCGS